MDDVGSEETGRKKLRALDLNVGVNRAERDIPLTNPSPALEQGNTHYYNVPTTAEKLVEFEFDVKWKFRAYRLVRPDDIRWKKWMLDYY